MTYTVLMYADPAATEAMSAAERAEVFRDTKRSPWPHPRQALD
ncbi:hypothetical protein [Streptomyces sp. NPDC005322]